MDTLKNKGDLLALALGTGLFLCLYVFVQSGRWRDALYGLGIYGLLWGLYFFQRAYREEKRAEKMTRGDMEDFSPETPVEGVLVQKVLEARKAQRDQETQNFTEKQALGHYLLRWSHQMKTPMAALLAWLDAQEIEDKNPRLQVFKMEEYLESILSYERLQGRDTDYVFQWLDLKSLLQKSIRAYAPAFIDKGLGVHLDIEGVEVLTDGKWLSFLVKQWFSNVVKYTKKGGLTISFREGVLVLEDTGIGIAREDLPRVMDMGYTGYIGRDYEKSTGIGLYLIKEIAQNLNLDLDLESKLGQGTSLSIIFPGESYRMSH